MTIRITGMNSGLDTESIIKELASARSMKVENIKKDQTKLSWKIDAWKDLNSKIYSLYTDVLSDLRFDYAYSKKTTKVSNPNAASVVTGGDAVNGVQTMEIKQLAKSSYLTGGKISKTAMTMTGSSIKSNVSGNITGSGLTAGAYLVGREISDMPAGVDDPTLSQLGIGTDGKDVTIKLTLAGKTTDLTFKAADAGTTKLSDVAVEFQKAGIVQSMVFGNFFMMGIPGGVGADFQFSSTDAASAAFLGKLGLVGEGITKEVTPATVDTTLGNMVDGFAAGNSWSFKVNGNDVSLSASDTLNDVVVKLTNAGVYATFDEDKKRFIVSAEDGADLKITAADANSTILLKNLGLYSESENNKALTGSTSLAALGVTTINSSVRLMVKTGVTVNADGTQTGGEEKELTFNATDTLDDVVAKFEGAGLNAWFNEATGSFMFSEKTPSTGNTTFAISAVEGSEASKNLLKNLGLEGRTPKSETVTSGSVKLSELGFGSDTKEIKFKLTIGGKEQEVTLKGSQTLDDVAAMLKEKGLNAKFDAGTGRFFISAKESGEASGFEIEAMGEESKAALANLGLYYSQGNYYGSDGYTPKAGEATMVKAQDAKITLNGVEFTSAKNTLEINGLTITAQQETKPGETITLTTQQDTDGIYDTIKNFIKKYNELINEMDKLYNAKSASKYEPLTNEEKDAMSDKEVEEWEKKIKESLLRRDTTLYSVSDVMKRAMSTTFISDKNGVNNGQNIYLTFFGIETLGYFKAKENEKNAYHINGDKDDTNVKNNEEKLKKAIANDPDTVISFFKTLATNMYTELEGKMGRTDYSSAFTVYNDKQMEKELKQFETKITTEQKKLNEYTDRWYKKFSQMEVAMSKLQSKQNSLSGLFGQ